MMDRRRFLLISLVGALNAPLAAEAQQAGKVYRLGILSSGASLSPGAYSGLLHIIEVLRELGYVEGRTWRSSEDTSAEPTGSPSWRESSCSSELTSSWRPARFPGAAARA
jgi:hypothetical protein